MAETKPYRVDRVPVAPEALVAGAAPDYADTFEVRLPRPDDHTAEEWVRAALEQSAPVVRRLVRFVHGRVARFPLDPGPDSILGWRTESSTRDALHITTDGPLLRAAIVARRRSPTTASVTTFLFYKRRRTALLWFVIGPLHRRVAPYLIDRAASRLTQTQAAA